MNLQDAFLNQIRRDNHVVDVTLVSGVRMRGRVRGFDHFTIVLQEEAVQHLLYKHAVAGIALNGRVDLAQVREGTAEGGAGEHLSTRDFTGESSPTPGRRA